MAVIQISRIQHRKGLQQDLPQLASAELGWALDSRKLYIGNGTIAEGAPEIGVTEILTQYSDLLNISDAYTFRGSQSGYTSRTGPTTDQPITRTLQQKIDDYVNVRDFGATGDGNTNDTAALQRAIDEVLFGNFALTTPRLRRVIHVPAGVYLITASLKLPSYIILQGEGKGRTIIRQSSNLAPAFQLKDSENKIDGNYGTGSATVAQDIGIQDLTIEHLANQDLIRLDTTERVEFSSVVFKGSQSNPSTHLLTAQNAVYARPLSGSGYIRDVNFIDCDFYNCTQGVVLNGSNIRFIGCNFKQLSQALIVDTTASTVSTKNIKVLSSTFDQISRTAINVSTANSQVVTSVMSSQNYYGDVGTIFTGPSSNVAYPVITFTGSGNYSVGDFFERPETDSVTKPRVQQAGSSVGISFDANTGISLGMMTTSPARVITLAASQTTANTGIVFTGANTSASISYFLQREAAGAYRNGRIDIIRNGADIQYVDEYVEYPDASNFVYPGPTGVVLAVISESSTVAKVVYSSTSSGTGNLTYSITSLRI
jgi:hypothetical protein